MDSLCHPWFTTTKLSYRFPIFETSATALCGTTGIFVYMHTCHIYIHIRTQRTYVYLLNICHIYIGLRFSNFLPLLVEVTWGLVRQVFTMRKSGRTIKTRALIRVKEGKAGTGADLSARDCQAWEISRLFQGYSRVLRGICLTIFALDHGWIMTSPSAVGSRWAIGPYLH